VYYKSESFQFGSVYNHIEYLYKPNVYLNTKHARNPFRTCLM